MGWIGDGAPSPPADEEAAAGMRVEAMGKVGGVGSAYGTGKGEAALARLEGRGRKVTVMASMGREAARPHES